MASIQFKFIWYRWQDIQAWHPITIVCPTSTVLEGCIIILQFGEHHIRPLRSSHKIKKILPLTQPYEKEFSKCIKSDHPNYESEG